jgi:anti-sigma regulatory factor (Ser/Thr protein kinase)
MLNSSLKELDPLAENIDAFALENHISGEDCGEIQLALEEVLTNIIKHGYNCESGHPISLNIAVDGGELTIHLSDSAPPFNPLEATAPDLAGPLSEKQPGGLGIHLVKQVMTGCLSYERRAGQNHLILRKPLRDNSR